MNNVLLDSANQQIAQQRWRGLRVLAVDGSTGRLPDFLAIEEYFGKPSGSGVPLARFSRLFDVLNDQILHADMVPYATGERELAAEYLLYSRPDDLFGTCIYDRGYPAFMAGGSPSMPRNRIITVRVYGMTSIPKSRKAFVADGAKERIVVLTPNTATARQCREGRGKLSACHLGKAPGWCTPDSGGIDQSAEVESGADHLAAGYESLSVSKPSPSSMRFRGADRGERWQREKQRLEPENVFRPKPLGEICIFPRQDLCAGPDSYLREPGPVAARMGTDIALPASSARLSVNFANA